MPSISSRLTTSGSGLRRGITPLVAATLFALALLGFTSLTGQAAAVAPSGSASTTLGYGSAGQALKRAGVSVSAVAPSTQTKLSGRRVKVNSALSAISGASEFSFRGGLRLSKGKRSIVLRQVTANTAWSRITATVAGKRIAFFLVDANPQVNETAGTLKITGGKLRLTAGSAKLIKSKLRVKRLPAARVGGLAADVTFAFEDPYLTQCGLAATSRTVGTVPDAGPVPDLTSTGFAVGAPGITWGFKSSFNGYVNGIGLIAGLDGATVNRVPMTPPQVPPTGFTFPNAQGAYQVNGSGTADDRAYLNGSGGVMYCNQAHGFRIVISNPTVVIDGESSRLIADVDTNISGDWMPTQRVDFASLAVGSAVVTGTAPNFTWATIPATLSQTGADALRLCEVNVPGAPPGCLYPAGTVLNSLTVSFTGV